MKIPVIPRILLSACFLLFHLLVLSTTVAQDTSPVGTETVETGIKIRDSGHVYRMNYFRSVTFSVAATAANIYAIPNLIKAKKPLSDQELNSLNRSIINPFDRWALEQDPTKRPQFNELSDHLLTLTSIGAAGLLLDKKIRPHWLRITTMFYETSAITFSLYNFSPFGALFQHRVRPFAYYEYFPVEERKEGNSRNSFYSGHVANAAAASFYIAKVYSDYHPEIGNKKFLLYGLATLPPLAIGYLRVKSLFHFPSDCLAGMAIGAACGIIVPETHRIKNETLEIALSGVPSGAGISLRWFPARAGKTMLKTFSATAPLPGTVAPSY